MSDPLEDPPTPHQRLLEATAAGLANLLHGGDDEPIEALLRRLATATDVDRAFLADHLRGEDGIVRIRLLHEWTAEGFDSARTVFDGRQEPSASARQVLDALEQGHCVMRRHSELPPDMQERLAPTQIRSALVVPVEVEGRCWGQLGLVDCRTERSWSSDEQAILRTVAAALGLTIEGRRAHHELERHVTRIRALQEAVADAAATPGEQVQGLLALAAQQLDFEIAVVIEIADDPDERTCEVRYAHGPPGSPGPGDRLPLARQEWSQAVTERRTTEVADFLDSPAHDHPIVTRYGMRSFIGVPVWVEGQPFGAVSLLSTRPRVEPFGPSDRDFVGLLGCWVGSLLERERAEQQRERLELRLRERAKVDTLALAFAGIAHDFSNMLMVISTNLHIARRYLARGDEAEVLESLDQADGAARRAAELKAQMLTFAGRGPVERNRVNVAELVDEMTTMLRPVMPPGVTIVPQCPGDLPRLVADATQLRQVLSNLILNAADAMREGGGFVWVRSGLEHFDAQPPAAWFVAERAPAGPYLWLEVEDAGIGIPPDLQDRIFDPFFTTKPGERGLGLASVRGITNSHHGCIDIASAPSVGTRIRVWLPLNGS